jgi:SCP-2 sterol transfer family
MSSVSAPELREILDEVMKEIDADPDDGSRLRAVAAPLRLEFTDLNLALNISRGDEGHLTWDFKKRSKSKPKLGLKMDSDVANRMLQGRENPAIAIARGRLQTTVRDPGSAVRLFPAVKPLFVRYRELVAEKYPHLAVEGE